MTRANHPRPKLHISRAFTLVEMVIAVAIILVLLGILLPAATSLWAQRKVADAENLMQGLLQTSRAQAMRAGGVESGLLFYVDPLGVQRVVGIEQVIDAASTINIAMLDVFRVTEDRDNAFPIPMRAIPRYAVDENTGADDTPLYFSNVELARKDADFHNRGNANESQRHRNFFALLYSPDGQLIVRPNLLIQDMDIDEDGRGDRTGLRVGNGDARPNKNPEVRSYYSPQGVPTPLNPVMPVGVNDLAAQPGQSPVALNVRCADGVLIYDESLFNRLRTGIDDSDGKAMRDFLNRTAQPFYVSRSTGAVVRGPIGEGVGVR